MFLVRSIRRRLVTGYTVALILLLFFAWAAVNGLHDHQAAVERLRTEVSERPDPNKLKSVIFLIESPMYERVNWARPDVARKMLARLKERISDAKIAAGSFWQKSEDAPAISDLGDRRGLRHAVFQGTMSRVRSELVKLESLVQGVDPYSLTRNPRTPSDKPSEASGSANRKVIEMPLELERLRDQVNRGVVGIISYLNKLPVDTYVVATLNEELRQSQAWMKNVFIALAGSFLCYGMTIYLGFRWISNPLRALARGASRIANGDSDYRLKMETQWKDEFFDMTTNFNRMADRFQESERDLAAKVEERSRQLVRSERLASVGCLAAGVAHEINNPLSAITIAAQSIQFRLVDVLDADHEDTALVMERLQMIQTESKRCGEITRRLLDFSRDEKHEKPADDLTRVIGEVLAMIRPMRRYQNHTIEFDRVEPLIIEINASQIKQVILNLVTNGLQATGVDGIVEIEIQEQTDWVVVNVTDNGVGITAEDRELMFEPFYSTKETGEGTGLGLSITNRIVQQHNGTIEPISEGSGLGTTFCVRLPRKQPAQKAA